VRFAFRLPGFDIVRTRRLSGCLSAELMALRFFAAPTLKGRADVENQLIFSALRVIFRHTIQYKAG
jgi:hypothetical protein